MNPDQFMYKATEIQIAWGIEDVYSIRPDLTEDQAMEVLTNVKDNHDADIGVCRDTLQFWADSMFPKSNTWASYTVEITETLQMQVDVEANSFDEAVEAVKRAYKAGLHILGAEHFISADFAEAGDDGLPDETGVAYD